MIDSVREFLRLFDEAAPASARQPERLCEVLDRLSIAYHKSGDVSPTSDLHPPRESYNEARSLIQGCFPDLGFYGWSAPEDRPGDDVMVGDAIDDLTDIYGELRGVTWLCENASPEDALWHFRFGYQSHWGRHLLNLRSYLHSRLYEQ